MNIVRISDGLGNQIFQYAFARKLQILTKREVYLDTRYINNEDRYSVGEMRVLKNKLGRREYGLDKFKIVLRPADKNILSKWDYLKRDDLLKNITYSMASKKLWLWRYETEGSTFPLEVGDIRSSKFSTYYQGYFFHLNIYDDIKQILQKELILKNPIALQGQLKEALLERNTVSVHIRRGDFLKVNRDISGSEYYAKSFDAICKREENPVFLVFSDDIRWVKENIDIPGEKYYVSDMGFADYEEMMIMKHCSHNIIANSTFSYWGAYLNANPKKIVICPKRWRSNVIPGDWLEL